jgi:SAM-dependent methyltransferase
VSEGTYTPEFFSWAIHRTRSSAEAIVPLVLERVRPTSVVDVGCGIGVWLDAFAAHGVDDYLGVDGPWVPREALLIPEERFVAARLDQPLELARRFDLAVALEVAEHLPEHRASGFVGNLVGLAPCILFSAAIPHQGGTDHLNEQWLDYWAALFATHGYAAVDGIRPVIWSDPDVLPFYRQNVVIFSIPEFIAQRPLLALDRERTIDGRLSIVHPDLMQSVAANPSEHVRRPSARELRLSELLSALPAVFARSVLWRITKLTSRRRRRGSRP